MDISQTSQTPPPIPSAVTLATPQKSGWRQFISILLSICLLLFIADAALSVLDDSLGLAFRFHGLRGLRALAGFFAMLLGLFIYFLMAFTPAIPKRLFAPAALFNPLMGLITIPVLVYFYNQQGWIGLLVSILQLALGLFILVLVKRRIPTQPSEANEPNSSPSS